MYLEKYKLDGRVAVVTGGGQGIGFACAHALAEAGAKVVVAELAPDRAVAATAELRKLGLDVAGVPLDVTKSVDVDAVAARIEREHGPVEILVNNAGVARSDVRAEDTTDAHWRFHMDVNLDGLFWCCRAFGRRMLERHRGSIVNIGSMSGVIVNKPQPQSFYNASKAAVHHLTKSLAAEWASRGVRVNAVLPGLMNTPMAIEKRIGIGGMSRDDVVAMRDSKVPLGRKMGTGWDVAYASLFLHSDEAKFISGVSLRVDGAQSVAWGH